MITCRFPRAMSLVRWPWLTVIVLALAASAWGQERRYYYYDPNTGTDRNVQDIRGLTGGIRPVRPLTTQRDANGMGIDSTGFSQKSVVRPEYTIRGEHGELRKVQAGGTLYMGGTTYSVVGKRGQSLLLRNNRTRETLTIDVGEGNDARGVYQFALPKPAPSAKGAAGTDPATLGAAHYIDPVQSFR